MLASNSCQTYFWQWETPPQGQTCGVDEILSEVKWCAKLACFLLDLLLKECWPCGREKRLSEFDGIPFDAYHFLAEKLPLG